MYAGYGHIFVRAALEMESAASHLTPNPLSPGAVLNAGMWRRLAALNRNACTEVEDFKTQIILIKIADPQKHYSLNRVGTYLK